MIHNRGENLAVAALHILLKESDICLFEKVSSEKVRCIFMALLLIDVEHVQGVICGERIRTARCILAPVLVHKDHHLGSSVRELVDILIEKLRVFLLVPVRVLHIKEREICDRIAFILGCLVTEMRYGRGFAALLQVLRTESIALLFAEFSGFFGCLGIEHFHLFDILCLELLIFLSGVREYAHPVTGENNTYKQGRRYDT